MSRRKKYQINLFEQHFEMLNNALGKAGNDRLIEFINSQKRLIDLSDEIGGLNDTYEKLTDMYESQQSGVQH